MPSRGVAACWLSKPWQGAAVRTKEAARLAGADARRLASVADGRGRARLYVQECPLVSPPQSQPWLLYSHDVSPKEPTCVITPSLSPPFLAKVSRSIRGQSQPWLLYSHDVGRTVC